MTAFPLYPVLALAASFLLSPISLHSEETPPAVVVSDAVLKAWESADHAFTPEVKEAFLLSVKSRALEDLQKAGKTLPDDFLAWVDSDPIVRNTVYGVRQRADHVLLMLRSLEIDLGKPIVRNDYTQLALAMAVVHAAKGPEADLADRDLLQILIPGDPRVLVDTKDPNRPLDMNDHIINFLNETTIEEDVVVGYKEEPPPLKYDDKGIAILPSPKAKPVKTPVTERQTRSLRAADVMASKELQEKFNAYMKEKGQEVHIDCGDQVIHWKSTAAVKAERKPIAEAFTLFRTAYEEKGLLPKARDASPTPAESMAYYIRNDNHAFADGGVERKWPRYPLKSAWPSLTLLAADNQPLREREERWIAFRDKGEMRTYGEYTGGIAQQSDMQSARRLTPFAYQYGTYQMMAKDGGVCGTMANMGVRTYNTLGIPSCTAGQPGHCALIYFAFDPKTGTFDCKGGQFATGGPDKTSPHTPWVFGDVDARKPMLYYQTIAWSLNHSFASFLDGGIAWQFFRALPETAKTQHGMTLLISAIKQNPYNLLVADAAQALAKDPQTQISFYREFSKAIAAVTKPGCPPDGLLNKTLKDRMFNQLAALPAPGEIEAAKAVMAFAEAEGSRNGGFFVKYQNVIIGNTAMLAMVADNFQKYLASARTEADSIFMLGKINSAASLIEDKKARVEWLLARWKEFEGRENYLDAKHKIIIDSVASNLAKATKSPMPEEKERIQSLLDRLTQEFEQHLASPRTVVSCKAFSVKIVAVTKQLADPEQARQWLLDLQKKTEGRETFKEKDKEQKDATITTIQTLLAPPAAA